MYIQYKIMIKIYIASFYKSGMDLLTQKNQTLQLVKLAKSRALNYAEIKPFRKLSRKVHFNYSCVKPSLSCVLGLYSLL